MDVDWEINFLSFILFMLCLGKVIFLEESALLSFLSRADASTVRALMDLARISIVCEGNLFLDLRVSARLSVRI